MTRKPGGLRGILAVAVALAVAGACSESRHLTEHSTSELVTVPHRRVALLPFSRGIHARAPQGAEEVVTGQFYSALVATGRFSVTTPDTVADAQHALAARPTAAEAARVGEALATDVVIIGSLSEYVDRVGGDYGVETPASVAFTVDLVEAKSGHPVWHGEFAEEQQPLLTDLGGVSAFWSRRGRWLTAAELSDQGARQVVEALEVAWFGEKSGVASSMPNAAATPACTTCPR
jgi:hypothetical protein